MSAKAEIKDAVELIERFGGIRPMAKKLDVAVTTVQGWKKRENIPPARVSFVLEAAERHSIDLSDIVSGYEPSSAANENAQDSVSQASQEESASAADEKVSAEKSVPDSMPEEQAAGQSKLAADVQARLSAQAQKMEKKAMEKTLMIFAALAVLVVAAAAVLFLMPGREMPQMPVQEDVAPRDEQGFMGSLIPDDLDQRIATLQEQAGQAGQDVRTAAQGAVEIAQESAQEISASVFAPDTPLAERIAALEVQVRELGGSPVLAGVLSRYRDLNASLEGQSRLDESVTALRSYLSGDGAGMPVNEALAQARGQDAALAQTFEGVPSEDLKAAAMLLAMNQLRSALNRDEEDFTGDLQLLRHLTGEDDPALVAAIDRLSPHARGGVLTPQGLSDEFRSLSGDILVASLSGEDVSVQERARARMHEVFQVEKDGELVTGTDTQATLARTDRLLEAGDIEAALSQLQGLEGPAAQVAHSFIERAQAALLAQQVKASLRQAIDARAYGSVSDVMGGGTLIRDEESGLSVFKPN